MLALIGLDATPGTLLAELESEGLAPRLAALRQAGSAVELSTPAGSFAAGAFPTLWSGIPLSGHGIHYPFMWDAAGQRVRYVDAFDSPPSLWERVSKAGGKVLVVDPYEAPRPRAAVDGLVLSGWQFANRVVLRPWSEPRAARRDWQRRLGRARRAEEVFGEPDERRLRRLAATLEAGPRRVSDLVVSALPVVRPDVLVVALPSVHLAGHQALGSGSCGRGNLGEVGGDLQASLRTVVMEADAAVGAIVDALPAGSDIVVFSSLGMAAADQQDRCARNHAARPYSAASSSTRARRAAHGDCGHPCPPPVRGRVASALPDSVATSLAARLELRGMNWSRTRAFAVPSDTNGLVRFNVRGREREGIVAPSEVEALVDEIRSGLEGFTIDGEDRAVSSVEVVADAFGGGAGSPAPAGSRRALERPPLAAARRAACLTQAGHDPAAGHRQRPLRQSYGRRMGARRSCVRPSTTRTAGTSATSPPRHLALRHRQPGPDPFVLA